MLSVRRNTVIVASVLLAHVAALWALQSGLLRKAVEIIVPVEVLSELISPPSPRPSPPVLLPPPHAATPPKAASPTPSPVLPRPAETLPSRAVTVAPANSLSTTAVAPSPSAIPAPTPTATAPPSSPPASLKMELPSSDAQYLHNPEPPYPPLSFRLGESGTSVVRVLIGVDGTAQKAEIQQSSGFDRLDQAALKTVLRWRYVPGKRGGAPEAMWYTVPIRWRLPDQ